MELGRIRVLYFLLFFYKKYFFAEQADLWPKILRVLFRLFLLEVENREIFLALCSFDDFFVIFVKIFFLIFYNYCS